MFLALVHFRYEFQDEGNYASFGLSMRPLPESDYLQNVEQLPKLEDGHEGACAAGAVGAAATSSAISSVVQQGGGSGKLGCGGGAGAGAGAGTPMAAATKLSDASLPLPGSSARSSVTSTTSSLSAFGPAGGARRGSGEFGGGEFQPLPPLDAMHQRLGSLPLPSQGRADAWGSHDMAVAVSAGDAGRGLDDSINSRGIMNGGGGGGAGLQDGIGGGGVELDSGRGAFSSGWARASSRGDLRIAGGL